MHVVENPEVKQCSFGGIACIFKLPVLIGSYPGIGAKNRNQQQLVFLIIQDCCRRGPVYYIVFMIDISFYNRHFVLGQRAGLVGTYDRCASQGFD